MQAGRRVFAMLFALPEMIASHAARFVDLHPRPMETSCATPSRLPYPGALAIHPNLVRQVNPMHMALRSLLILLVSATAAQAGDLLRTVPSGRNQRIDFLASVNPDCSSIGTPTVRLVEGPDHGVVTTDRAKDFMPFPKANVRHKCNDRRVAGLRLYYQSAIEFFGTDRVRLLVISASGDEREATYVIRVK